MNVIPKKLVKGDEIRIIAPSMSMSIISKETREIANKRFQEMGFKLSFGKHIEEIDDFTSSSVKSRVDDLHDAFADKSIKAILTVIGGFNSNQLLDYIDWDLIKKNPKLLCGYSDITILNNAIFAMTGLVTYSGPHYSSFGQKLYFDYTLDYFKKCLMEDKQFEVKPSKFWSDDAWYEDQDNRKQTKNNGFLAINEGEAQGTILGGNFDTFKLLFGTQYMPNLTNSVLFIEDDDESKPHHFDRVLQSLIQQPGFNGIKGIVIGRFQKASEISNTLLNEIIKTKRELDNIPVTSNVDFGHTDPKVTFPIGGSAKLSVKDNKVRLEILKD